MRFEISVCRHCPYVEATTEEIPHEEACITAACSVVSGKQYVGHTAIASNKPNRYSFEFEYIPATSVPWDTMKPDAAFYVPDECPMRIEHP